MVTKNEYFITHMKLRELREQRGKLLRTYGELYRNISLEQTEVGRLRVLYEGLRQVTFADQKLHPDVANLEPLLERADGEPISMEAIAFWRERLEKELAGGQLRSEIVYIFGAVLEEWASSGMATAQALSQREQLRANLIEHLLQPARTGDYTPLLDTLFTDSVFSDEEERAEQFQQTAGSHLHQRISPPELATVLAQLSSSPYHSILLRKQAHSFLTDNIMQKELADALTIMIEHLDEWQHPQEGVAPRELWTLNKWRLCIDEDLPTVCFLEILGKRWQSIFQRFFNVERTARLKQQHGQHLLPQAMRLDQAIIQISQGLHTSALTEVDIWEQVPSEQRGTVPLEASLGRWEPGSIDEQRLRLKSELHDLSKLSSYDALQTASGMEKALMLINAEIELARTSPTPVPLYLLKLDCKDFYPSLSHQALLGILKRYGATPSQCAFFSTFLRIPLQHAGQIYTSERGVPNYHALSDLLGDLVLSLFEQYVQRQAHVQIVRMVDDICILATSPTEMTSAWQAAQAFCEAFGLVLNEEKCGSLCLGGERLSLLPPALPGWLLVTLDQQGRWNINWSAFDTYLQGARQQVMQATSLISQIEAYNAHLQYLVKALAMRADLGSTHRNGISTAMERFYRSFFGEGQSVVESIRGVIRERFLGEHTTTHIPEAWLCWPITAGGCGLVQATILAASYQADFSQRARVAPPEERAPDWQYRRNAWSSFYRSLTAEIRASEPTTNQVMEALVNDFIRRGSEMSNRHQAGLSPYWRWILYIYGPQILDLLGTFRFLITELVPLQLIIQQYRHGTAGEQSEAGG